MYFIKILSKFSVYFPERKENKLSFREWITLSQIQQPYPSRITTEMTYMSLEKMKIITNLNAMQHTANLPFGGTNI